jgi:hypothetical protein
MASATAANGLTVNSATPVTIFDPAVSGRCHAFGISNRSDSANPVLVNVAGVHDANQYMGLEPGESWPFAVDTGTGIGAITVKVASGSAVIDYGVISRK